MAQGTPTGYRAVPHRAPISERPAAVSRDHRVSSRWWFTIRHDAAGLCPLISRLLKAGVEDVGIECPDGPVVEALLQTELTVLVIPPSRVKNLRSRYGTAGNKDDRFDAYVLGDVVRTDRRRLRPLVRDSAQIQSLAARIGDQLALHPDGSIQFRDAVTDFAGDSRHANPWAADLYAKARVASFRNTAGQSEPPASAPCSLPCHAVAAGCRGRTASARGEDLDRQNLTSGRLTLTRAELNPEPHSAAGSAIPPPDHRNPVPAPLRHSRVRGGRGRRLHARGTDSCRLPVSASSAR